MRCAACCCWHSCSVSYPSACFDSWLCCVFKFCCKSLEAIAKRQQAAHTLIQCEGARGQGMGHCLIWLSSAESECWQHPWLTCVGLSLFNDLPLPLPFVLPFFFFFLSFFSNGIGYVSCKDNCVNQRTNAYRLVKTDLINAWFTYLKYYYVTFMQVNWIWRLSQFRYSISLVFGFKPKNN